MLPSGETVHVLPCQLVMVEWGLGDGSAAPVPGAVFQTGWFDTWRLNPERVIQPLTGQEVSTDDESVFGTGTHRRAAVYCLDLFCRHTNDGNQRLLLQVQEIMTPALFNIGLIAFVPTTTYVVPPAGLAAGASVELDSAAFVSRRHLCRNRMVRLRFTYPTIGVTQIHDWYLSAILRSA